MCFSKPNVPEPQAVQQAPQVQDPNIQQSRSDARRRQRAAAGAQSTILTAGGGTNSAPQLGKTLLGQ